MPQAIRSNEAIGFPQTVALQAGASETPAPPSRLRLWVQRISFSTAGTGLEVVLRFVRTVVLSHLLLPVEFGVTVAIATVIFTCELVSDIGLERFVLTKSEDNGGHTLATAQTLQIGRGLILAAGVLLLATPTAKLFGVPEYRSSFMLVSIILIIRGFAHLGVKQVQRNYEYRPEAISIGVAQTAALILSVATAYVWRDHRAILVAFGVEALALAIMTHRLAPTPFTVRLNRDISRAALAYGLPLLVNGIALAIMSQADRFMVAYYFGIKSLALYGVILTIAMVPLASVYRIVSSVALPMLVRDRETSGRFEASYRLLTWGAMLVGCGYAYGLALGLDIVTPLIFGKTYTVPDSIHVLVSLIVFARVMRWPPTMLLLAIAETRRLALANMICGLGIVIGVGIVMVRAELSSILIGVLIGEIASTLVFQYFVIKSIPAVTPAIYRSLIIGVIIAATMAVGLWLSPSPSLMSRLLLAVAFTPSVAIVLSGLWKYWKARETTSATEVFPPTT